jgi:hypothetical protein
MSDSPLSFKHALFNDAHASGSAGSQSYPLLTKWTFYSHLPHDTDWSLNSYKRVFDISSLEDTISLMEHTPKIVIERCMLFIMKSHIKPIWEDALNKNGGSFSFKVEDKNVYNVWKTFVYLILGGSLCSDIDGFHEKINGISISPKKGFCIVKIWMATMEYSDHHIFDTHFEKELTGIENNAIFKSNKPEYSM